MHAEFRDVLNEEGKISRLCDQLRKEWYTQLDGKSDINKSGMAFCVAHVLRRPTDVTDIFCDFSARKDSDKPLDDMVAEFFDGNEALASEVQRRRKSVSATRSI
ncbi:hypothetical protein J3459_012025 [Metarhizium acridum]|uniref:uncharacterized protein n=1 Tax=Metarhizium acridum TaxID=92637 RepID=UPI001C6C7551|nr:hypothetical protein J3458_009378 [Metarhizium acridum]KAG8418805.1 hypothetical protein J3459_012025 [Metarhizium acridum]